MTTVGIITNTSRDKKFQYTNKIIQYIELKEQRVLLPIETAKGINRMDLMVKEQALFKVCDFLIILGGDGTLLRAARNAAKSSIPLVGINLGTLGYLTDVEATEYQSVIDNVLEKRYHLEKRMMLDCSIMHSGKQKIGTALNEVCIKCEIFKMLRFKLYINDKYVDTYHADGIVIATPTGSTAYNLSAGGPILIPDSNMIAITPICPHTLEARPIVVSSKDKIKIEVLNRDAVIDLDGQYYSVLQIGQCASIGQSELSASIIKTNQLNFYDILRNKL